jgi:hypothetical protein
MNFVPDHPQTSQGFFANVRHQWAAFAVLFLASLCCMANNVADPDLWGHVQFGRDLIRDGIIHPTTTYSFTATGYRWINHEILSELVLAVTYDNLGIAGLIIGKLLLTLIVFLLIVRCALRNGAGPIVAGATVFLAAINLSLYWNFRPQLASYVDCAAMLAMLEWCFHRWRQDYLEIPAGIQSAAKNQFVKRLKWLWLVPVVLMLWANSHGGFVAGLCIFGAYLAGRILEAFLARGSAAWGMSVRLAMLGMAGLLATLINPYGPNLHFWLLNALGEPRPEIRDWHPVDLFSVNGTRFAIVCALTLLGLAFSKRTKDWTKLAVMAIVCWQACTHVRHVSFFVLLFAFWMPVHLQGLADRLMGSLKLTAPSDAQAVPASKLVSRVYAAVVVMLFGYWGYAQFDLPVDRSVYPVAAFQFIADQHLDGPMVVTYNWAQYAIGSFGGEHENLPVCPVGFDGRFRTCYPQQIVDMNFDFVMGDQGPGTRHRSPNSGPLEPTRVLEFGSPELVVISRLQRPAVDVMRGQTDRWCLLYQDKLAQIWGRKSRFDNPDAVDYLPVSRRHVSEDEQKGTTTWPALPQPVAPKRTSDQQMVSR